MTTLVEHHHSLLTEADGVLVEVLEWVWSGSGALVLASPPGAGKTYVCSLAAALGCRAGERVALVTQTTAQAADLTRRLAEAHPDLEVHLLTASRAAPPPALAGIGNCRVVDTPKMLPTDSCIVVATAARWTWVNPTEWSADLMVVDEAWQMTSSAFALVAGLSPRFLLVGDPGQIAPVTTADIRRWRTDPAGPHRPAPEALVALRPSDVTRVRLPATRRLGPGTAALVQPAFYPELPFGSLRPPRALAFGPGDGRSGSVLAATADAEMVRTEVPGPPQGLADPEVAEVVADLVRTATATGRVVTDSDETPLDSTSVGVVCAHVSQAAAVRAALGSSLTAVRVDTAERWQGLEAELVVAWHPLSGRAEVTDFGRDSGRLCVMLSRHRAGCVVVGRPGISQLLTRAGAGATRELGVGEEAGWRGWLAHTAVLAKVPLVPVSPLL